LEERQNPTGVVGDDLKTLHVAVAQVAPRKRAFAANVERLGDLVRQILADKTHLVDVLVLPETALTGYFLEGGVLDVAMTADDLAAQVDALYREAAGPQAREMDLVIGFIERRRDRLFNAVLYAVLGGPHGPRVVHVHRKFFLPSYGVFDEARYVNRGRTIETFPTRAGTAGMLICEDAWHGVTASILALRGARVIYIPVASPARGFSRNAIGNASRWTRIAQSIAEEHGVFVVTANLVGFEGGKGFIGASTVVDPFGEIVVCGPAAEECVLYAALDLGQIEIARASQPLIGDLDAHLPDLLRELSAAGQPRD